MKLVAFGWAPTSRPYVQYQWALITQVHIIALLHGWLYLSNSSSLNESLLLDPIQIRLLYIGVLITKAHISNLLYGDYDSSVSCVLDKESFPARLPTQFSFCFQQRCTLHRTIKFGQWRCTILSGHNNTLWTWMYMTAGGSSHSAEIPLRPFCSTARGCWSPRPIFLACYVAHYICWISCALHKKPSIQSCIPFLKRCLPHKIVLWTVKMHSFKRPQSCILDSSVLHCTWIAPFGWTPSLKPLSCADHQGP